MKKGIGLLLLVLLAVGESAAGRMEQYATFRLEADVSGLSGEQRAMLKLLVQACEHMDEAFWLQAYGDKYRLTS